MNMFTVSSSGCWNWNGLCNPYGTFNVQSGEHERSHRASYRLFVGEIPKKMVIMHLCENHKCVNPSHLKVATQAENMRHDITGTYYPVCKKGHPMTMDNVIWCSGNRRCRTCHNARSKTYYYADVKKTRRERMERYFRTRKLKPLKTHCPNGHPWIKENIYVAPQTGWNSCLLCRQERNRINNLKVRKKELTSDH